MRLINDMRAAMAAAKERREQKKQEEEMHDLLTVSVLTYQKAKIYESKALEMLTTAIERAEREHRVTGERLYNLMALKEKKGEMHETK